MEHSVDSGEWCNNYISEPERMRESKSKGLSKTRGGKEKQKRRNEEIRRRGDESERDVSRLTVWPIDGSVLTETELDGRVSLSGFSVCCADKTVMGKNIFLFINVMHYPNVNYQ